MRNVLWSLLLLLVTVPAFALVGDLIYRPEPASGTAPATPDEGVLVRTITIRRGDTLSGLAKRYAGKGYYFPQILLFNQIHNPNLIYTGDTLKVPVSRPSATAEPLPRLSAQDSRQEQPQVKPAEITPELRQPTVANAEQKLFERGMGQFRKEHYRAALALFDRYLREFPDAPHAADVTFYRGECYLNLSRR